MPVATEVSVPASSIKKGDVYCTYVVEHADPKVKWVHVTFTNGAVDRVLRDSEVVVVREVPTEEEKAAKELVHTLNGLDWKERSARQALAAARAKMQSDMESGARADYWNWMNVPQAQAVVDIWDKIAHVHAVRAQSDNPVTRVEAVRAVMDAETRQVLSYYRALSRSTSVVSNLFDDLKMEAISQMQRELEWIIMN